MESLATVIYDLSNPKHVLHLKHRVMASCKRFNVPTDDKDDVISFVYCRFLEYGKGQTIDQCVVDYFRTYWGRKTNPNGRPSKYAFKTRARAKEFHKRIQEEQQSIYDTERVYSKLEDIKFIKDTARSILKRSPRKLKMFNLRYESGLDMKTIGKEFGVTESRVCQLMAELERKLKKAYKESSYGHGKAKKEYRSRAA